MSSYSARDANRRGSVVPPLAGVDRPTIEVVPDSCDVLICGTGLTESILAAALAWQGSNVLHIDSNDFYGDSSACMTMKEMRAWIENVANNPQHPTDMNAQLYMPRPFDSARYLIDLAPHVLFAKSDMLDLLIKSRVFRYLEFKPLGQFHTYEKDSFEKVAGNKEAIFTDQRLSPMAKRNLMKFIKFIVEWKVDEATFASYKKIPISKFLSEEFKLEAQQITELVIAIGLSDSLDTPTNKALTRIRRYLLSLDIYGYFPVLYSMYGSGGELAQGFCRSAAVAGATYRLNTRLESFDEKSNIATLSDGSRIQVAEKVFISPTQSTGLREMPNVSAAPHRTTRLAAVVSNESKEWFAENESAAIVAFPPGSLDNNKSAVHTVVHGPGAGHVPPGYSAWYLRTDEQDLVAARRDLEVALQRLESSILRESSTDFDLGDLAPNDVSVRENGSVVVSSVKLGQSMQNFVPRQKLQYLLKLGYTQPTQRKPSAPVPLGDSKVVMTLPYQLNELSYDGFVAQARKLYEAVVGSDDDFFDVDFEDDDDDAAKPPQSPEEEVMHDMEM